MVATLYGMSSVAGTVNIAGATTVASSPSISAALVPYWGRSNATTNAVVTSVASSVTGFVYNEATSLRKPWLLLTAM